MTSNQPHQEDFTVVKTKILAPAPGAYSYPLLIKSLLLSGARYAPDQEIVYADKLRYSYATFNERVARLANVLSEAGVKAGDTVAVMDWDSHRYLEAFFAVPMMGAVLQTVNVRLSPEQILYTLNHARADVLLVDLAAKTRITQMLTANAQDWLIIANSAGYGFTCQFENLLSRQKAGKSFITLENGESLLKISSYVPRETSLVACLAKSGKLHLFPLAEFKQLSGGGPLRQRARPHTPEEKLRPRRDKPLDLGPRTL